MASFHPWQKLGRYFGNGADQLACASNRDGRIEVFITAWKPKLLLRIAQLEPNSDAWGEWTYFDPIPSVPLCKQQGTSATLRKIAAGRNTHGDQLAVFAITEDAQSLVQIQQVSANGNWGNWSALYGKILQDDLVAVVEDMDGPLTAFVIDTSGFLSRRSPAATSAGMPWQAWEGQLWCGWFASSLLTDCHIDSLVGVGANAAANWPELFCIRKGTPGEKPRRETLHHTYPTTMAGGFGGHPGQWEPWNDLGGENGLGNLTAGRDPDGLIDVLGVREIGGQDFVVLLSQFEPMRLKQQKGGPPWGSWHVFDWAGTGGVAPKVAELKSGYHLDGRLAVFVLDEAGVIRYRTQRLMRGPNPWMLRLWTDWEELVGGDARGEPFATLCVGSQADGRLVVFASTKVETIKQSPGIWGGEVFYANQVTSKDLIRPIKRLASGWPSPDTVPEVKEWPF